MLTPIDGFVLPDLSDPVEASRYLGGTYQSGWGDLKCAVDSSLHWATVATGMLLNDLSPIEAGAKLHGEVSFVVNLRYDLSLSGPCLSAVLLSCFALEAFLRLGYLVVWELANPKSDRRKGFAEDLKHKMHEFDSCTLEKKFHILLRAIRIRDRPDVRLCKELSDLREFRNTCAHESPTAISEKLEYLRLDKYPRTKEARTSGGYPTLGNNLRPIRLRHAVRAIGTHDDVVSFVMKNAPADWVKEMRALDSARGFDLIREMHGARMTWKDVKQLSRLWEKEGERAARCSDADHVEFITHIRRRMDIRLEE